MAECSSSSNQADATLVTGSDAIALLTCDLCSEDGLYIAVEGFCVECSDYLCRECVRGHKRNRIFKNHAVKDTRESNAKRKPEPFFMESSKGTCTEECELHSRRIVEYYCHDHASLGCSVCITMIHRQCTNVDHIPDLTPGLLNSQIYKQFHENASTLIRKYKRINGVTKANIAIVENSCSGAVTAVKELREKLNREFDRMEEELCTQAESLKSDDVKKLTALSEKGTAIITEVEKLKADFHCLESSNQLCQLFIQIVKTQDKLSSLFGISDDSRYSVRTYTFVQQPDMEPFLNGSGSIGQIQFQNLAENAQNGHNRPSTGNAHLLDELNTTPINSVTSPRSTTHDIQGQLSAQYETAKQSQFSASYRTKKHTGIIYEKDICVKTASHTWFSCNILSSTLLSENKLVLADFMQRKVKLLQLDIGVVVSELPLDSCPYAVTTVNTEEVAITLPDEKNILFVKVSSVLKRGRTVPAGGECIGIVYGNGKLITSYRNPARIVILSLDGIPETIVGNDSHGNFLFKDPRHHALSPDGETIYVSDKGDNSVKSISLNGTVKAVYEDKSVKELGGITVDNSGHVIVCEQWLEQLHLLSPDCRKINVLGYKLPWVRSVSYCEKSDKLYVGFWGNCIKVFKLIYLPF